MTHMWPVKVDFDDIEWTSPASGARFKSYVANGKQLRLLELSKEFIEPDWCDKGHIGLVLEGSLQVDFQGQLVTYKVGDGVSSRRGRQRHIKHARLHPSCD